MRLLGLTAAVASLLQVVVCAPSGVVSEAHQVSAMEKRSEDQSQPSEPKARDANSTTKYFHEPG